MDVSESSPPGQAEPRVEVEGAVDEASGRPVHVADPARRRAILPWLIAAGTLLVVGGLAFGLTFTPMFRASDLRIEGEAHFSEAKILRIAGLSADTNLLHADLSGAVRRLEHQPWIARAAITRSLPHTLDIRIVERVPVARTVASNRPLLVSAGGTILGGSGSGSGAGFPLLSSMDGVGELSASALRTGAAAAGALPPALRPQVRTIDVDAQGALVLRISTGIEVTYGDSTQLEAKAQSLMAVLAWAEREGKSLASIDVTVPGSPTASLTSGTIVARPEAAP